MLFSHMQSVRAVHLQSPWESAHVTCMPTHTHANPQNPVGASSKCKTVFKLPGFIVQSERIPFHVTNKWIRQARKMSGLKNEHGNTGTSFDKSCLCLTLLSAPQGHIRGTRVTLMGLIALLFCFSIH